MTKLQHDKSKPADLEGWRLPVVNEFLEGIKKQIFKAAAEALECAAEESADIYFASYYESKLRDVGPLDLIIGIKLSNSDDGVRWNVSLRDVIDEIIQIAHDHSEGDSGFGDYIKKMKETSAGLKVLANDLDEKIAEFERKQKVSGVEGGGQSFTAISAIDDPLAFVEEIIKRRGISASRLAREVGLTPSTLNRPIKNRDGRGFNTSTLKKLKEWDQR